MVKGYVGIGVAAMTAYIAITPCRLSMSEMIGWCVALSIVGALYLNEPAVVLAIALAFVAVVFKRDSCRGGGGGAGEVAGFTSRAPYRTRADDSEVSGVERVATRHPIIDKTVEVEDLKAFSSPEHLQNAQSNEVTW